MIIIKSLSPLYDAQQDRILIAVNAGQADECSFWLTRRMTLTSLARLGEYLDRTSEIAAKAPVEFRLEVAAMERAAAASTASLARTPNQQIQSAALRSELATKISVTPKNGNMRLELFGDEGNEVSGGLTRAELQTILILIRQEASKADWFLLPVNPARDVRNMNVSELKKSRTIN